MDVKIVDEGGRNPCIVVEPDQVVMWLRTLADKAGYADRESCAVQIQVEQGFCEGAKLHGEPPRLVFMVSNIPNSRKK